MGQVPDAVFQFGGVGPKTHAPATSTFLQERLSRNQIGTSLPRIPAAYILPLRLPQEVMVKEDAEPELTSPDPADIKRIYKYGKLIQKLPWFAVEDTFTPVQKFENSPYYTLERETIYECVKDWTNDSEVEIDKVYEQVEGTTLENAKNFQKTTGISTTLEFEQPGTVLTTGGVSGSITFNQSWEEGWSNRIATTDTKVSCPSRNWNFLNLG